MTTAINRLAVGLVCLWVATAPARAEIIGNWDFSTGSLQPQSATTGMLMTWLPSTPYYSAFGGTGTPTDLEYKTADSFGIAPLNGFSGRVMRIPDMSGPGAAVGLMATFPLLANGTYDGRQATKLNRYSLIMDVLVPRTSFKDPADNTKADYINLFQPRASADGSLFVCESARSVGGALYSPDGSFQPDTWYRVALVMSLDAASDKPRYSAYLDGTLVNQIVPDRIPVNSDRRDELYSRDLVFDGAWSIGSLSDSEASLSSDVSAFFLFNDSYNDGKSDLGELYIANLQFRNDAMTSADVAALGSATGGIIAVPEPRALLLAAAGAVALAVTRGFRKRTRGRS